MKPTPLPERAAVAPMPPALVTPALDETERTRLGLELENYFSPLVAYCEAQPADEHLSEADFRHGFELRQALAAFVRYEAHTEQLLTTYRRALGTAQQLAAAQIPSLEGALGLPEPEPVRSEASRPLPAWTASPNPTPAELLAEREAEPLYRLGYVRGYRQAEARYEQVVSLYAQYAILVPPPGYTPSPLVQRVNSFLESPALQARAALPLEQRRALASLTLDDLLADEPR